MSAVSREDGSSRACAMRPGDSNAACEQLPYLGHCIKACRLCSHLERACSPSKRLTVANLLCQFRFSHQLIADPSEVQHVRWNTGGWIQVDPAVLLKLEKAYEQSGQGKHESSADCQARKPYDSSKSAMLCIAYTTCINLSGMIPQAAVYTCFSARQVSWADTKFQQPGRI